MKKSANKVEFIVVGDLHLNSMQHIFTNLNIEPNDLIFKAFEIPINYALENGISTIIQTGDIFDNPNPTKDSQEKLLQFLIKYKNINFYFITGNHDYNNVDDISIQLPLFVSNISKELSHVKFISKPELLYINGVPFSFLPWPYCKTLFSPSINIAHVEVKGSKSDNGKVFDQGYKLSTGEIYIVGHLHQHQEIGKVYYVGNLAQKTFGETLPKGFYVCQASYKDNKLTYNHQWESIKPPYKLVNLKILKSEDLKQIKKPDPKNIVQYKLMMRNGVELPVGFREDYLNVTEVTGKLSARELSSMEQNSYQTNLINTDVDYLEGLDTFLKKEGLTPKEIQKARNLVEKYTI